MGDLYDHFFVMGNVRSLNCGQFSARKEQLTPQAVLEHASDASPQRIKKLQDLIGKSPTGKHTLEEALKAGIEIRFETGLQGNGVYSPRRNAILLNPARSNEAISATLVHEARHVWQDKSQDMSLTSGQTPKTIFMTGFATEADASAVAVLFAHEMRATHPEIWATHQKSKYAPMSTAFERTYKETNDLSAAMNDSFLAWYDLSVKDLYAGDFTDSIDRWSKGSFSKLGFGLIITPQEISENLCRLPGEKGGSYLKNPAVLESAEKLNIPMKDKERLDAALIDWAKRNKHSLRSIHVGGIFVKDRNGMISPGKKLSAPVKSMTLKNKAER